MRRVRFWAAGAVIGAACLFAPSGRSQPAKTKAPPKLEPVAETKLLMNGLADPNFKGVGKLLKDEPTDPEAWEFARARALLVAETGNLLLMRPPKARDAEASWMTHASGLREAAAGLARDIAARNYVKSRAALAAVANECNRCHHTFRVGTRVRPFSENEK
jgi:cytochrome c556